MVRRAISIYTAAGWSLTTARPRTVAAPGKTGVSRRAHGEASAAQPSATTMMQVGRLLDTEMLVEIQAEAVAPAAPGVDVRTAPQPSAGGTED